MIQRALFLVCAVLATVSPFATCQNNKLFKLDYIDTTSGPHELLKNIKYVRSAISRIEISDEDSLGDVLTKIETLRDKHSQITSTKTAQCVSFCDDMLELSEGTKGCDLWTIERTLQIVILLNRYYDESLKNFARFFIQVGGMKFSECALNSVSNLENHRDYTPRYEHNFDRFFRALLQMDSESDEVFLESLKLFDLASDDYETQQAVQIASEILTEEPQQLPLSDPFVIINHFFYVNCEEFTTRRWGDLQVLALDDLFAYQSRTESVRVQKMKEYSRLCLMQSRSKKIETVKKNIQDQLNRAERDRRSGSATGSASGSASGSDTGSASGSSSRSRRVNRLRLWW